MDIGELDTNVYEASPFIFELAVQAQDLQEHWKRCNMLANYIAEYIAYQFPEREWAENLISTVTNEFLEAVTVLSPNQETLLVRCRQQTSNLLIEFSHGLRPELVHSYTTLLQQLSSEIDEESYFKLLTAHERPAIAFNQLGLVMIAHDFHANIAANLDEQNNRVVVRVIVPTREIAA